MLVVGFAVFAQKFLLFPKLQLVCVTDWQSDNKDDKIEKKGTKRQKKKERKKDLVIKQVDDRKKSTGQSKMFS